jgi:nitroreductase
MDALEAIKTRISPAQLTGPGPTPDQLHEILLAGASAPDHGRLQPWRFILIEGDARQRLGELMARSIERRERDVTAQKVDTERKKAFRAPLIIVVAAVVQETPKVPVIEQIVAAGAAAQNMLLAAHAMGLGGFWRTGALAYDPEVRRAFGLTERDTIVAMLYIGSDAHTG